MIKKTAAAYELARKFLQKGDSKNARLAMDIGDRFKKVAGVARGLRMHPAVVDDDLDATHRNLDLIDSYIDKVKARVSRIDPDVFSGLDGVGDRGKKALRHLQDLEKLQHAIRDLMSTNRGRKSVESNMALDHLKDLVQEDLENGVLEGEDAEVMKNYISYLQPDSDTEKDMEFQFRSPPGRLI